jgi:uncharacterized membrane protein YcgQ (UPF0703/DUF1980 family)
MMIKLFDDEAKNKKWKDRIVLGCIIFVAVSLWLFTLPPSPYQESINKYSGMSESELQKKADTPLMDNVARTPGKYEGKLIKFTGEVLQVQQSGNNYVLRVSAINWSDRGNQDVWVSYRTTGARPLEDDYVTVVGVMTGMKTYTTVLGSSKTIPAVTALYI